MTRLNWRLCGGLGKIRSAKVANYTLGNNYFQIQLNYNQQTVVTTVEYILGFAVFVQHRESNAINNEHFMRMFPPNVFDLIAPRCILMCVISLFIISDSK